MSQVSLNTRISPATDKMLREWQKISGKSLASIVDDAIISHLLLLNKELVMKHLDEGEEIESESGRFG